MGPDLNPFISLLAQDKVAMNEVVPKEQVPNSNLSADEVAGKVKERLRKVREQREANLLDELRPTDRVFKYTAPPMRPQSTQRTEIRNRGDLEEEQKADGKGPGKEPEEKSKEKDKGNKKDLRLWQPSDD